jgi:hypothetical protein
MPAKGGSAGDSDDRAGVEIGRGRPLSVGELAAAVEVNPWEHNLPWSVRPSPMPDGLLGHATRVRLAARDDPLLSAQDLGQGVSIKNG